MLATGYIVNTDVRRKRSRNLRTFQPLHPFEQEAKLEYDMDVATKPNETSDCQEFELETDEITTPSSSNFTSLPGVAYYSCKVRSIS